MAKEFLTRLKRTRLNQDISRRMVAHLIRGDWRSGEKIPIERDLCRQLGVGRASLREALKALEIMGMLETRLGDGTYVCERSEFLSRPLLWTIVGSSETEIHDLLETRRLIEVELAGLAAKRVKPEDLWKIQKHLNRMRKTVDDLETFAQADVAFHLAIGAAAHNTILMNAFHLTRNLLQRWIATTINIQGATKKAIEHHKAIFAAISKKDPTAARDAMSHHLDEMRRILNLAKPKGEKL